jgi:hypothetical protein
MKKLPKLSSFYLFSQFRSSPASQKMDRSVWPWSRRRLWCVKHRQIIVRLSDPGVKFRILKCGKNLKQNPEYRHVYLNEDLTVTCSTICYHARQLVKRRKAKNVWTTNGKISLKDKIKKNQIGFISYSWMTTAFYNTIKHN